MPLHLPRHHRGQAAKHELEMVKYALNNVDEEIYACSLDGTMNMPTSSSGAARCRRRPFATQGLRFLSYEGSRQWMPGWRKIRRDARLAQIHRPLQTSRHIVAWDIVAYIIYDYFQERFIESHLVLRPGRDAAHRTREQVGRDELILECISTMSRSILFVKDPSNESSVTSTEPGVREYSRFNAQALGHTDYEIFPSPKRCGASARTT